MGGDHAPEQIVLGALEAAPLINGKIILVGDADRIAKLLPNPCPSNIHIHPASQSVGMDEKPMEAYRKKKDSSLAVAACMVKEGEAEAMVSAGNTGAATATSQLTWRQIKGVHR